MVLLQHRGRLLLLVLAYFSSSCCCCYSTMTLVHAFYYHQPQHQYQHSIAKSTSSSSSLPKTIRQPFSFVRCDPIFSSSSTTTTTTTNKSSSSGGSSSSSKRSCRRDFYSDYYSTQTVVVVSPSLRSPLQLQRLQYQTKRCFATRLASSSSSSSSSLNLSSNNYYSMISKPRTSERPVVVYGLILIHLVVFITDKVVALGSGRYNNNYTICRKYLYLTHWRWQWRWWWQPLTTCFCHANRTHLSQNMFLLLLFGRSVEDDLGGRGLLLSYCICGSFASLVSLAVLVPTYTTISIGASGAVFGLFAISVLNKLLLSVLFDWRKIVELFVLGEFVVKQLATELTTTVGSFGGTAIVRPGGVNHVAHIAGATAGALIVLGMRMTVARFERRKPTRRGPIIL